jgi:hypothetical protein
LKLEKDYGWTGLLVEPNPYNVPKLRLKNRKAWIADVGFSFTDAPIKVDSIPDSNSFVPTILTF